MDKPVAYMNHGRWLYDCPRCKTPIDADREVCPRCWPGIVAKAFQPIEGGRKLRRVEDAERVRQAREEAAQRKELWRPIFPPERSEIEHILRYRPIQNMNWEPGESVAFLLEESLSNGVDVPPKYREE